MGNQMERTLVDRQRSCRRRVNIAELIGYVLSVLIVDLERFNRIYRLLAIYTESILHNAVRSSFPGESIRYAIDCKVIMRVLRQRLPVIRLAAACRYNRDCSAVLGNRQLAIFDLDIIVRGEVVGAGANFYAVLINCNRIILVLRIVSKRSGAAHGNRRDCMTRSQTFVFICNVRIILYGVVRFGSTRCRAIGDFAARIFAARVVCLQRNRALGDLQPTVCNICDVHMIVRIRVDKVTGLETHQIGLIFIIDICACSFRFLAFCKLDIIRAQSGSIRNVDIKSCNLLFLSIVDQGSGVTRDRNIDSRSFADNTVNMPSTLVAFTNIFNRIPVDIHCIRIIFIEYILDLLITGDLFSFQILGDIIDQISAPGRGDIAFYVLINNPNRVN